MMCAQNDGSQTPAGRQHHYDDDDDGDDDDAVFSLILARVPYGVGRKGIVGQSSCFFNPRSPLL